MSRIETYQLPFQFLNRPKTISVYLPESYDINKRKVLPVLYMHDGHNLFDPSLSAFGSTWDVQKTLDNHEKKTGKALIVVGIHVDSIHRYNEYSPWPTENLQTFISYQPQKVVGGEGEAYIDWIVKELKPFIDTTYRTKKMVSYMAGSSMGGYISLYAGVRHADTFDKVGIFSPAFWFNEPSIINFLNTSLPSRLGIYMTMGKKETSDTSKTDFPKIYLNGARKVSTLLIETGYSNLVYKEYLHGIHSESEWAKRFPEFIEWLLK